MERSDMKTVHVLLSVLVMVLLGLCNGAGANSENQPASLDMKKAEAEVEARYAKAHPEVKEFVLHTARTFGRSGMWLNEAAFAGAPQAAREKRVQHLATLLADGEYGRHLCAGLAEASAVKDKRLVP